MSDKSEFERTIILDILAKDRLEGLPLLWLKSKLEQILDGTDPRHDRRPHHPRVQPSGPSTSGHRTRRHAVMNTTERKA